MKELKGIAKTNTSNALLADEIIRSNEESAHCRHHGDDQLHDIA